MTPDALRDLASQLGRGYRAAWRDAYHLPSTTRYDPKISGTIGICSHDRLEDCTCSDGPLPDERVTPTLLDVQTNIAQAHHLARNDGVNETWQGPARSDKATGPTVITAVLAGLVVGYRNRDWVPDQVVQQLQAAAVKLRPWTRGVVRPAPPCLHCRDNRPERAKKWCSRCRKAHQRSVDNRCVHCRDADAA